MTKDIEKLLNAGLTPEKIYAEASRIAEAKAAAAEKAKKNVADKRTAVLKALDDYTSVIIGAPMTPELHKELDDSLKFIESTVKAVDEKLKNKTVQKTSSKSKSDDEILSDFLKMFEVY